VKHAVVAGPPGVGKSTTLAHLDTRPMDVGRVFEDVNGLVREAERDNRYARFASEVAKEQSTFLEVGCIQPRTTWRLVFDALEGDVVVVGLDATEAACVERVRGRGDAGMVPVVKAACSTDLSKSLAWARGRDDVVGAKYVFRGVLGEEEVASTVAGFLRHHGLSV
jgi:hypothetical protein